MKNRLILSIAILFCTLTSFAQEPLKWGQTVGIKINEKSDSVTLKKYSFTLTYNDAINVIEQVAPRYGKGVKQNETDKRAFSVLNEYFAIDDTLSRVEVEVSRETALKLFGNSLSNGNDLVSLQKKQADLDKEFASFYAKESLKLQAIEQEKRRRISKTNSIIK